MNAATFAPAADSCAIEWSQLSDTQQLHIAREAMRQAANTIAGQAEILAGEMDAGGLIDRGGPDALRLFAAVLRVSGPDDLTYTRPLCPGPTVDAIGHA